MSGTRGSHTELYPLGTRIQKTRISCLLVCKKANIEAKLSECCLCEFIKRRLKRINAHYIYLSALPSACIHISGLADVAEVRRRPVFSRVSKSASVYW
jgi:hypothetical protein